MAFSVNDIRSALKFGGTRNTLFTVQLTSPAYLGGSQADQKLSFTARASEIPDDTIGTIQVGYFGRKIKLAGDRVFQPWTTTVINDEDFLVRNNLEAWMSSINGHQGNLMSPNATNVNYKSTAIVTQYAKNGNAIRTYQFNGIFPAQISPIQLNWDQIDTIEEFQVQWNYDFWTIVPGTTGTGGSLT